MEIWYGYRSTIARSGVAPITADIKPNGSNRYKVKSDDIDRLPPSHVTLSFNLGNEVNNVDKMVSELLPKINEFLTAPGAEIDMVYDLIYDGDFTGIYEDNSYVTVPQELLDRLISSLDTLPEQLSYVETDSSILYNEAPLMMLTIDTARTELHLEYITKSAYVYAAGKNKWLIPYANRLGFRKVGEVCSIVVPYWEVEDLDEYYHVTSKMPNLPSPSSEWSPGYIRLSNGLWYKLPFDNYIAPPSSNGKLIFNNQEYDVSVISGFTPPFIDWRLGILAKVYKEAEDGLLPYDKKFPDLIYNDSEERISMVETHAGKAVVLMPDEYILGLYPSEVDAIELIRLYRKLWENGSLLNVYGHYCYSDSHSSLDKIMVNFIGKEIPPELIGRI